MKRIFIQSDWRDVLVCCTDQQIYDFINNQCDRLASIKKNHAEQIKRGNANTYYSLNTVLTGLIEDNILIICVNAVEFSHCYKIRSAAWRFLQEFFNTPDAVVRELNDKSEYSDKDIAVYKALRTLDEIEWEEIMYQYDKIPDRLARVRYTSYQVGNPEFDEILKEDVANGWDKSRMIAFYRNIDIFSQNIRGAILNQFMEPLKSNVQIISDPIVLNPASFDQIEIKDYGIHEAFIKWLDNQVDVGTFLRLRKIGILKSLHKD